MRTMGVTSYVPEFVWDMQVDKAKDEMPRRTVSTIKRLTAQGLVMNDEYNADLEARRRSMYGISVLEGGVPAYIDGERVPRNDCQSILFVLSELLALDRYERRVISRCHHAIETLGALRDAGCLAR